MSRVFVFSIVMTAAVFVPALSHAQEKVEKRNEAPGTPPSDGGLSAKAAAQLEGRIHDLETRVAQEESSLQNKASDGAVLFLYGAFCALWAKNTGRSAWLWFFMGMIFNIFTAIVLLAKNAEDQKRRGAWAERSDL